MNAPTYRQPVLAADHSGMRVDYSGMLKQAGRASLASGEKFHEFMLSELREHMQELGRRYYAGDAAVVDEFLQLYCVEKEARDTAKTAPPYQDPVLQKMVEAIKKGRDALGAALKYNSPDFYPDDDALSEHITIRALDEALAAAGAAP